MTYDGIFVVVALSVSRGASRLRYYDSRVLPRGFLEFVFVESV